MTVPTLSIVFMAVSGLIAFVVPIVLLVVFRKKGARILPFFVGCAVFVLFALVLESAVHRVVLGSPVGAAIQQNIWLYALYGGLMAGLFEETGRFFAFKTVLRRNRENDADALMYGAGHGGIEAMILVGVTMISNIAISLMINAGTIETLRETLSEADMAQLLTAVETLSSTAPYMFLMSGVERLSAILLHVALSVLVWFAAKDRSQLRLFPLAILIHAAADAIMVILSGAGLSVIALEAVIMAMAAAAALLARRVWRANATSEEQNAVAENAAAEIAVAQNAVAEVENTVAEIAEVTDTDAAEPIEAEVTV